LAKLANETGAGTVEQVNSSHHQAVRRLGDRLKVSAVSGDDQVVEAIELASQDHFVLGVQWHPERTFAEKRLSREIFRAFADAAQAWTATPEIIQERSQ
jgi:putative glutamine amidotransferase